MNFLCTAANSAWVAASLPKLARFRRALANPKCEQEQILRKLLGSNAETAFGREHGFAKIRSPEEYRQRVPVRSYDDFAPWIERIRLGESNVLTAERVLRLIPSSGSTSARKLIPYTASLQREFGAAIAPWVARMYLDKPSLATGPAYWSVSPVAEFQPPAGSQVPVGFEVDTEYLGGFFKFLVDATLAVPGSVRKLRDIGEFRYATVLHLLRQPDLRLVSVWHPSFLMLLLTPLFTNWERLVDDIKKVDRRRANEIRRIGPLPEKLWPKLGLISCWADSHAALSVGEIRREFPGANIQPKGLIATEGFVSLPFGDQRPVAACSHYFEFINEQGQARGLHELDAAQEYSVVLSTGGGLYRYALRDQVRVTGFLGRTPTIEFVGKQDGTSDLFGEKLSQGFVASVLARLVARNRIEADFCMLSPEQQERPAKYVLFINAPITPAEMSIELEGLLQENPHYRYCVELGQLGRAKVVQASPDAFAKYVEAKQIRGQRIGDIKPAPLDPNGNWLKHLVSQPACMSSA
ncbi:MAG: GH3 auxin-responsive promoter family protein [Planctomycetes bacterium]|nr:GH3 auxin-responsive promoter family protein [Planctomycetota bacterium]